MSLDTRRPQSSMAPSLLKRQCASFDDDDDCYESWWWTDSGVAVRYALVVGFFVSVVLFLLIGYIHAQRRLKKGLPPLAYHRWLVSRRSHPQYNYQNPSAYYQGSQYGGQAYGMQNYPPAPPAYNTWDAPPQYQPPTGGSKALANQHIGHQQHGGYGEQSSAGPAAAHDNVEYPAPAHPPPQTTRNV